MRIPNIEKVFQEGSIPEKTIKINNYTEPKYYEYDFIDDDKDLKKFIKKTESIIRQSYEYKDYIKYLKENIDMNSCTFFKNATRDNISIEIHHTPFTLYDIVSIVMDRFMNGRSNWSQLDVANEVMELHYKGEVGLVPLSVTVHELVHSGRIFIPIQNVYGNLRGFIQAYKTNISPDLLNSLNHIIKASALINNNEYKPTVLNKNLTYLEVDGMEFPEPLEIKEKQII